MLFVILHSVSASWFSCCRNNSAVVVLPTESYTYAIDHEEKNPIEITRKDLMVVFDRVGKT